MKILTETLMNLNFTIQSGLALPIRSLFYHPNIGGNNQEKRSRKSHLWSGLCLGALEKPSSWLDCLSVCRIF